MSEEEKKKTVQRPRNFDEFLTSLDTALTASDEKSKLRNVLKAIKLGYGADPKSRPTPEEVEQIANWLKDRVDLLDLCLKQIATSGGSGALFKQLRQTFTIQIRQQLDFPPVDGEDLSEIKALLTKTISSCTDKEQLSLAVKRCVAAVWVERMAKQRTELLRFIVEKSLVHHNRRYDTSVSPKAIEPYSEYFNAVLRAASKSKVDFKVFENANALMGPLRLETDEFERSAGIAREQKYVAEEQLHARTAELEIQVNQVQKLEAELRDTIDKLATTRSELELEQRKSSEIRSTLTTRHGNELGGQLRRLEKLLTLEIEEAIMCLDREEPNVAMALNRIRDLDSNLKKFVESATK